MTLQREWNAIGARIRGLERAGAFHISRLTDKASSNYYGIVENVLHPEARAIFHAIEEFQKRYEGAMDGAVKKALEQFLKVNKTYTDSKTWAYWSNLVTGLISLSSEIDFHLTDFSASARRMTERAFIHLQRSIVADDQFRSRWQKAFKKGETACERLGSVHLLFHGIWAFKINASGERTDLIMSEPRDVQRVADAVDALVLTEWKLVRQPKDLSDKADEARKQAKLYVQGSLAGLELASDRYCVLVSEQALPDVKDVEEGGVRFRHINIAVEPGSPSKIARQR